MTASVQNIKRLLAHYVKDIKGYDRLKPKIRSIVAFLGMQPNLILKADC